MTQILYAAQSIPVSITEIGTELVVSSTIGILGQQYDNLSQTLVFTRPASGLYNDYDLVLYFRAENHGFHVENIGVGNAYTIPNDFTQGLYLEVQVSFRKDDIFKRSSNILIFTLIPSITFMPDDDKALSPHDPPEPSNNYYTKSEVNALFSNIQSVIAATQSLYSNVSYVQQPYGKSVSSNGGSNVFTLPKPPDVILDVWILNGDETMTYLRTTDYVVDKQASTVTVARPTLTSAMEVKINWTAKGAI